MILKVVYRGLANLMSGVNAAVEIPLPTATVYGVWQPNWQAVWCLNKVFPENFSTDILGPVRHHHVKGHTVGHIQHNIPFEKAAGVLSWLLTANKLGANKIVCLYIMFDSHRQLFTTLHGATWLLAIAKCTYRVNITFMVLFMGAVILIVGHCDDVSVVYLFLQKRICNFICWVAPLLSVLALSSRCSAVSSASGRR